MKIPLFYYRNKVCWPHVYELVNTVKVKTGKVEVYECSLCNKIKTKWIKENL